MAGRTLPAPQAMPLPAAPPTVPATPDFHALLASRFFPFTTSLPKLPKPYVIPCAATSLTGAGIQEATLEFAFPAIVPNCPASPPITTLETTLVAVRSLGSLYAH